MVSGRSGHRPNHHRTNGGYVHDSEDDSDNSAMNSHIVTRRNSKEPDLKNHMAGGVRSNSNPLTLPVNNSSSSHSEKNTNATNPNNKNGGHMLVGSTPPSGHHPSSSSSSSVIHHLEGMKTSQSNVDLPRSSSGQISPRGPVHLPPMTDGNGGNISPRGKSPAGTIEHLFQVKTPSPTLVGPPHANNNGEGSGGGGSGGGGGGSGDGSRITKRHDWL